LVCRSFYEPKDKTQTSKKEKLSLDDLNTNEQEVFTALKQWRNDFALNSGWSAFGICHNAHLMEIAKIKPETMEELEKVKGFGEVRTKKYGEDILAVLNVF
jgi:superfamily II DNA helicase RecQ